MNFDSSHDHLYSHRSFLPSPACHFFFDQAAQDHAGFYDHHQLYRPSVHVPGDESYGGSACEMKSKVDGGLQLGLWRKEEDDEQRSKSNPIKWMSSKMRVMQRMKHTDDGKTTSCADQKAVQPSSLSVDADSSSYTSSYSNSPIRVCSDCNTTKTPLWRSGPKGPKSLCNACGIRQRKARRAMAAAAAAAAATNGVTANASADQSAVKLKLQHKGKLAKNGHVSHSQLKKRCKTTAGSPSAGEKQLGFEDFLINLSKNLAFQRVFPEDEKDAAILLMALSSGLVNG